MGVELNISGTWKDMANAEVNIAGTWKQVEKISVNISGVWKTVWENFQLVFSAASYQATGSTSAEVLLRFNSDGTIDRIVNGTPTEIGTWCDPTSGLSGNEQIRITSVVWNSGVAFTTADAAEDVWTNLSGSPQWGVTDISSTAGGAQDVDFTVEIRASSGDSTADTATCNLIADWEV